MDGAVRQGIVPDAVTVAGRASTGRRAGGLLLAGIVMCVAGCGKPAVESARLPPLPIDPASVTVSGISSGGAMAVQFHVAYSAAVSGAGVLAAPPYYCAADSMRLALGRCTKGEDDIPTADLIALTSQLALEGAIDPIAGLATDRVWIYHGASDPYVSKPVTDALETYYRALVDPAHVVRVEQPGAGHTFPTARADAGSCASSDPPYVGNCGLDGARSLLSHLYGDLRANRAPEDDELAEFDQRPYAMASGSEALADRGWIYVPKSCRSDGRPHCRLHVVFHGCKQGAAMVGKQFILGSGYLETAAANDVVVLFPQIEASYRPLNPMGCWDWWGYEGPAYAVQDGAQITAIRMMVADLLGESGSS
jgi:poly(3-hydroxybutyrate) depolymerase